MKASTIERFTVSKTSLSERMLLAFADAPMASWPCPRPDPRAASYQSRPSVSVRATALTSGVRDFLEAGHGAYISDSGALGRWE